MEQERVFEYFCNFGSGLGGSSVLDTAKFSKLCRETGIIYGGCTATDVDLVFKKVLGNERKMGIEHFKDALAMLSAKRFPSQPEGNRPRCMEELLANFQPKGSGSATDSITQRLTDTKYYTGSHKHRFDDEGRGRGLEGRDLIPKGKGHIGVTDAKESDMKWKGSLRPNLNDGPVFSHGQYDDHHHKEIAKLDQELFGNISRPTSARNTAAARPTSAAKPASSRGGPSIFDRLTDSSQYTGSHKHRFDSNGNGRGLMGRDTGAIGIGTHTTYHGGAVTNLAQITRPGFR